MPTTSFQDFVKPMSNGYFSNKIVFFIIYQPKEMCTDSAGLQISFVSIIVKLFENIKISRIA